MVKKFTTTESPYMQYKKMKLHRCSTSPIEEKKIDAFSDAVSNTFGNQPKLKSPYLNIVPNYGTTLTLD